MALLHTNQSSWNKKSVLFVHGIGFQPREYSEPLYQLLRNEDPVAADETRWYEVVYDQANDAMKHKVAELQKRIPPPGADPSARDLAADFLVDLFDYLVSNNLYNWINNFVAEAFLEVLADGEKDGVLPIDHTLIVIAHSLGTVVSYEFLHQIVGLPQVPGLSSGVHIRAWLTMGSPLAFIKAREKQIPSFTDESALRREPIGRPVVVDPFSGPVSNVIDWFNYRQRFDPVGSLIPLDLTTSNGALSRQTSVFEAFHTGANPHDFGNYIREYRGEIMALLRE